MRPAVLKTLKGLYEGKKVTALTCGQFDSTRITNEITVLRNSLGIDIITDRVQKDHKKWYGSYRLVRTEDNLKIVKALLEAYSNEKKATQGEN